MSCLTVTSASAMRRVGWPRDRPTPSARCGLSSCPLVRAQHRRRRARAPFFAGRRQPAAGLLDRAARRRRRGVAAVPATRGPPPCGLVLPVHRSTIWVSYNHVGIQWSCTSRVLPVEDGETPCVRERRGRVRSSGSSRARAGCARWSTNSMPGSTTSIDVRCLYRG